MTSTFIEFTKSEQLMILSAHNEIRNLIASGKAKFYKPATRMAFMQWNDTLANVSSFNVKSCIFEHDECRNTSKCLFWINLWRNIFVEANIQSNTNLHN